MQPHLEIKPIPAVKKYPSWDLAVYYKDMLAFFWLMTRSQKTRAEVEPILDGYHTVDRIAATQNPLNPKIDVDKARGDLAEQSHQCGHHHQILKFLYALQMPTETSYEILLSQRTRNYFDCWLQKRNEHIKE